MPTKFYVPENATSSGIDIIYTKSTQKLTIGGWYDSIVGIQSENMTLRTFFDRLGITLKDCQKAFKEK